MRFFSKNDFKKRTVYTNRLKINFNITKESNFIVSYLLEYKNDCLTSFRNFEFKDHAKNEAKEIFFFNVQEG